MTATIDQQVSLEEYIATEQREGQRYEYHHGKLRLMPGGTIPHSLVSSNISRFLGNALDAHEKDCIAFNADLKVEVEDGKRFIYPDASVVCGGLIASTYITGAITNPQVVVEVLSKGSVNYDLTTKQRYYFSLPSVQEYLLVSQTEPFVTLIARQGEPDLYRHSYAEGLEATMHIPSLNIDLALVDIYRKVTFPEEDKE